MAKVCILCSLSNKDACEKAAETFKNLGMEVYHPFLDKVYKISGLYTIQKDYLKAIEEADIILAIPKQSILDEHYKDHSEITDIFGESVSYEMAFARHINKPIILWREL